ncbi:hypothetical protein U1Q18_037552 [Sarracenia purpurea var. burkii]
MIGRVVLWGLRAEVVLGGWVFVHGRWLRDLQVCSVVMWGLGDGMGDEAFGCLLLGVLIHASQGLMCCVMGARSGVGDGTVGYLLLRCGCRCCGGWGLRWVQGDWVITHGRWLGDMLVGAWLSVKWELVHICYNCSANITGNIVGSFDGCQMGIVGGFQRGIAGSFANPAKLAYYGVKPCINY